MRKNKITKDGLVRQRELIEVLASQQGSIVSTHRDMVELILRGKKEEVAPLFLSNDDRYLEAARGMQQQGLDGILAYVAKNVPKSYDIRCEGFLVTPIVLDIVEMTATLYKLNIEGSTVWSDLQGRVYSYAEMEQMNESLRNQADSFQNFFDPWHNYVDPNV